MALDDFGRRAKDEAIGEVEDLAKDESCDSELMGMGWLEPSTHTYDYKIAGHPKKSVIQYLRDAPVGIRQNDDSGHWYVVDGTGQSLGGSSGKKKDAISHAELIAGILVNEIEKLPVREGWQGWKIEDNNLMSNTPDNNHRADYYVDGDSWSGHFGEWRVVSSQDNSDHVYFKTVEEAMDAVEKSWEKAPQSSSREF